MASSKVEVWIVYVVHVLWFIVGAGMVVFGSERPTVYVGAGLAGFMALSTFVYWKWRVVLLPSGRGSGGPGGGSASGGGGGGP